MGATRRFCVTLLVLLVPAGAGVMTVEASPTCERYVRTYVTVPVRNKVSKATAVAWAKWRTAHPNWKPNPRVHRPLYKMSRQEQVQRVAMACEAPTDPKLMDVLFAPSDLNPPPAEISLPDAPPPVETADLTFPGDLPPVSPTSPVYPQAIFPPALMPPFLPPVFGTVPIGRLPVTGSANTVTPPVLPPAAVLPEPSSWLLLASGLPPIVVIQRRRAAQAV